MKACRAEVLKGLKTKAVSPAEASGVSLGWGEWRGEVASTRSWEPELSMGDLDRRKELRNERVLPDRLLSTCFS